MMRVEIPKHQNLQISFFHVLKTKIGMYFLNTLLAAGVQTYNVNINLIII